MASETKTTKAAPAESVYPAAELANNSKLFGTSREIVVVALRLAGKESATITEAKAIIDKFKNQKVNSKKKKEVK